jgi:hypothetical protein
MRMLAAARNWRAVSEFRAGIRRSGDTVKAEITLQVSAIAV